MTKFGVRHGASGSNPAGAFGVADQDILRVIAASSPSGLCVCTGDRQRVKWINPAYREFLDESMRDRDVAGVPLADVLPGFTQSDLGAILARVAAMREPFFAAEYEYVGFARGITYWHWSLIALPAPADAIPDLLIQTIEITESVRARKHDEAIAGAAQDQRRLFTTVLSSILDFIYIFDLNGRFLYSNRALADLLGRTPESMVGKNFFDLNYPAQLASTLQSQVQHVIDSGERLRAETPFTSPSGQPGYYEYILVPVLDDDGGVKAVAGSTRDISSTVETRSQLRAALHAADAAKQRLEATNTELQQASHRLVAAFRDAATGMILTDLRGRIQRTNDAFRTIIGYPHGDLGTLSLMAITHPDDRASYQAEVDRLIAEEAATFVLEKRYLRSTGTVVWVRESVSLLRNAAGGAEGVMTISEDITAQKLETEARVFAEQALRDADRHKDEFLAMLGHELRNPLSPILSAVEILKHYPGDDGGRVKRAQEIIGRQASHLRDLVDDLLDVARITTGKITLKKETLNIASAVDRAAEQVRALMEARRHNFEVSLPASPIYLEGDPGRITQTLTNLLSNAAKFTESGGTISLKIAAIDDDVAITVKDTGMGIHAEVLPRVFDLFAQSQRALDRAQGGLGIGLTIVRRLVELHGGRVGANSAGPGHGSEFTVYLPALRELHATAPRQKLPTIAGPKSRRILIVDDNVDAADMLSVVLSLDGHAVKTAGDGARALKLAHEFQPDVVLLDLGLPDMSGFDVTKQLRACDTLGHLTLIAVTGYGQNEDRRRTRAAGFDHHLVKPVELETLAAVIDA
ncbi:MAG: PAS domain-containing protein [Betaproteobacteria bacterium]